MYGRGEGVAIAIQWFLGEEPGPKFSGGCMVDCRSREACHSHGGSSCDVQESVLGLELVR